MANQVYTKTCRVVGDLPPLLLIVWAWPRRHAGIAGPARRARVVLAFNNPYSSVVREHIVDYFANGAVGVYGGMSAQGVKAHYYHRTLEDYLDAFLGTGLRLAKLVDVPEPERPGHRRFPRFMVLAFDRP